MGSDAREPAVGPHCEALAGGFLIEPVAAVSSLVFIIAGHAFWHVLAAGALVILAPVVDRRRGTATG